MAFFVIVIVFKLSQVFIICFFIFFDSGGIDASGRDIGYLALRSSTIPTRVFLILPTYGLTRLVWLASTSTIILVSDIIVGDLLSFRVFLISEFFTFYWLVASKTMCVAFSSEKRRLMTCLDLSIDDLFNDFL